jgi:hypothetical protein
MGLLKLFVLFLLPSLALIQTTTAAPETMVAKVNRVNWPTYRKVHCVNTQEFHKIRELILINESENRYHATLVIEETSTRQASLALGTVELYIFGLEQMTFSGNGIVAETKMLETGSVAQDARITIDQPFYDSNEWLCKAL